MNIALGAGLGSIKEAIRPGVCKFFKNLWAT